MITSYILDGHTPEPLLFETMIFKIKDGKVNYRDLYSDRYSTWEEAEEGHKKALEFAKTL